MCNADSLTPRSKEEKKGCTQTAPKNTGLPFEFTRAFGEKVIFAVDMDHAIF